MIDDARAHVRRTLIELVSCSRLDVDDGLACDPLRALGLSDERISLADYLAAPLIWGQPSPRRHHWNAIVEQGALAHDCVGIERRLVTLGHRNFTELRIYRAARVAIDIGGRRADPCDVNPHGAR